MLRPGSRAGRSWLRFGRLLIAGLLVVQSAACISMRLPLEALPEEPIAFLYWEDKDANKRSELFEKISEVPRTPIFPDNEELEQEIEIRTHLRGEEFPAFSRMLSKYPGRLMLMWPRTGEIERVEAAPLDAIPLAWSKDHKRLLFASRHRGNKEQLYEYHLERKDLSIVTVGPREHPRGDYADDDRLVIHELSRSRETGLATGKVHLVGRGGRKLRLLATGIPPGTLRVSPDADRLVFEAVQLRPRRDGPTSYESFVATQEAVRGAEISMLVRGREPTLTPDGSWIVFASRSSAGYRLRRMRPDGTSRVTIGPGGTEERMPSVSPDGEFVAYVQASNGKRRLAVKRFDGKEDRVLLPRGWTEFPVW